jgi:hypothetical protein
MLVACSGKTASNAAQNAANAAGNAAGNAANAAGNAANAAGNAANAAGNAAQNAAGNAANAAGNAAGSAAGAMGNAARGAMGAATKPNCGAVAPVWVNLNTRRYHEPGDPAYGNTSRGEYLCPSQAKAQGFRPAAKRRKAAATSY